MSGWVSISQITAAVRDTIAAAQADGRLSLACQAIRVSVPERDLQDLAQPIVEVAPRTLEDGGPDTRATSQEEHVVDVAIRQRVKPAKPSDAAEYDEHLRQVDGLVRLEEEICRLFRRQRLIFRPEAMCTGASIQTVWSPAHMRRNQFLGIVRLTFDLRQ